MVLARAGHNRRISELEPSLMCRKAMDEEVSSDGDVQVKNDIHDELVC